MAVNEERAPHANRLPHLVWEMYTNLEVVADEAFAGTGLSSAMTGTLDLIGSYPGATVAELSHHTPKSQQAISQQVARLEKLGYVERRLGSGRGVRLFLTDSGRDARHRGNERETVMDARVLELLGPELHDQLSDALKRALARIQPAADRL